MSPPASPKKILVIKFRSLGDTVLMTAPLAELKRAFPSAEVHVAVTEQWSNVLENHPAVHRIWPYFRRKETVSRAKAIARLALKFRKEKFDWVINFHASPSSAMLSFGAGPSVRSIHFHGLRQKNLHSTVHIPGKGKVKPAIERDMDALRALGLTIPEGKIPRIHFSDQEIQQFKVQQSQLGLKKPIVAIGLGSSRSTKCWPIERYAELTRRWVDTKNGSAILIAGVGEEQRKREFLKAYDQNTHPTGGNGVVDPGETPLRESMKLIRMADLFVGNDSGPKHLAIASGLPAVTLIGPEDPFEWHPYSEDRYPFLHVPDLKCRKDAPAGYPPWCGLLTCVEEGHKCMKEITVDQVWEKCEKVFPNASEG